jgi:hypothetical protein
MRPSGEPGWSMTCRLTELRGMIVLVGDHPVGVVSDVILDRLEETARIELLSGRILPGDPARSPAIS